MGYGAFRRRYTIRVITELHFLACIGATTPLLAFFSYDLFMITSEKPITIFILF